MKQQPDKLFREKLENFQISAPTNTWSKIEAGLTPPSYKGLWLKIAAGLVLLITATLLLWNLNFSKPELSLASGNTTSEPVLMTEEPAAQPDFRNSEQNTRVSDEDKKRSYPNSKINVKHYKKPQATTSDNETLIVREPVEPLTTELIAEATLTESTIQPAETTSGIFLTVSAEEVNEKYLRKELVDDATLEEKKSSRLQMLMGVAYNLKNGDSGFGDLRQIKDEIFALNFLDEKKSQTKKN